MLSARSSLRFKGYLLVGSLALFMIATSLFMGQKIVGSMQHLDEERGLARTLQSFESIERSMYELRAAGLAWVMTRRRNQQNRVEEKKAALLQSIDAITAGFPVLAQGLRERVETHNGLMLDFYEGIGKKNRNRAISLFRNQIVPLEEEMEQLVAESLLALRTDAAAANARVQADSGLLLYVLGGAFVIVILMTLAFGLATGWLVRRIETLTAEMRRLSQGDTTIEVTEAGARDEIGDMARAVEVFRENAIQVEQLKQDQIEANRRALEEKSAMMSRLADEFDSSVGAIVESVTTAATRMESSAQTMSSNAAETSQQTDNMASAADDALRNVDTAASGVVQIFDGIQSVARQVGQSTDIAERAVSEADRTNKTVSGLATTAQNIGAVVTMIQDIAEQTNLLALNATIEAARAGEAGKGFAVVASEVKSLASQTAKATEEISQQIQSVQKVSDEAVSAIGGIGATIKEISEIAASIATAVQQQGSTTETITHSIREASQRTNQVSSNISDVGQAASRTGRAADQLLDDARDLTQQGSQLRDKVQVFLNQVRSA